MLTVHEMRILINLRCKPAEFFFTLRDVPLTVVSRQNQMSD
jgi:hypothetical protein